jgi:ABC-2 type transport system ATP-binding protein
MMNIKISHVSKTIKNNPVIKDISMELQSGAVYGFKGINGSGKTMLMRLISGLIRPSQGEISMNGKILGKDISFPNSIGVFLENPAFLDAYSGFNNLKLLASIKSVASDDDIRNTLLRVGLDPDSNKKYKKYSLGMKQRLGIAAAIMEKPEIVILDEPTNSLDEDGVDLVKHIVRNEKERGALVVVSCHDEEILKGMSDEVFLLEQGRLIGHITEEDK